MAHSIFAASSSPSTSSSKSRFFGGSRKEVAPTQSEPAPGLVTSITVPPTVDLVSPISPAWSMLSLTDAPAANALVANNPPVTKSTPTTPSSMVRSGSRWLSLMRNGASKAKKGNTNHDAEAATASEFGGKLAGTVRTQLATDSGSGSTTPRRKEGKTRLGIHWLAARDADRSSKTTASASRTTPAPKPLQQASRHSQSDDEEEEEDESDLEMSSGDEMQMPLRERQQPGPSLEAPPPAAFYPPSPSRTPSSTALVELNQPRRPKPSRSHINLFGITSMSLQALKQSPHPLITPRSNGTGASQVPAPLFPRSCNPSASLPHTRSVLVTLHKARVVQRLLEAPGNLTASEELSIMPFATRQPGVARNDRGPSNATNSIYPSHFQLSSRPSSNRVSLTRSLMMEEGDPMREPDAAGRGCSTWSRGLKQWSQRPTFEQRVVMWIPRSASGHRRTDELGAVRTAVYRPALKAQTPLVFSRALEALAGVTPPRQRKGGSGNSSDAEGMTEAEPPLQHPRPIIASSSLRYSSATDSLTNLHIPSPPQPSSSPSTSGSTDTGPSTPRSLNNSAQNLPVFAPGHGRSSRHELLAPSDDDDLPLRMAVRRRESDDTVTPHRVKERKKAKDGANNQRKAYKEKVLADRMRRESYRMTGRMEVEEKAVIPTPRKGNPAAPVSSRSLGGSPSIRSTRDIGSESERSIRSSGSQQAPSPRPASIGISLDQTWLGNINQFGQVPPGYMVPGAGLMLSPAGVQYQGHAGFPFSSSPMSMNAQMFYPPPPMGASPRSASPGLSVGSMNSRRSSLYQHQSLDSGEFGYMPQAPSLEHHSRSLPNRSATFNGAPPSQVQQQQHPPASWRSSTLQPPHDKSKHRRSGSSLSQNSASGSDQRPEHGRLNSSSRASAFLRPSFLQSNSMSSRPKSQIS
ncbi:hypothetical protein FRB94_001029 [Tulasnella sp. JGI-2019a]|nr:hypothetical protein FRB94_001029 [Tulasnella sp. JGI-2019a]